MKIFKSQNLKKRKKMNLLIRLFWSKNVSSTFICMQLFYF